MRVFRGLDGLHSVSGWMCESLFHFWRVTFNSSLMSTLTTFIQRITLMLVVPLYQTTFYSNIPVLQAVEIKTSSIGDLASERLIWSSSVASFDKKLTSSFFDTDVHKRSSWVVRHCGNMKYNRVWRKCLEINGSTELTILCIAKKLC